MESPDKPTPYFLFPTPQPSERLTYERLELDNAIHLLEMFQGDENPFVSERFKNSDKLIKYCANIVRYARTSTQRGGADFLFKTLQGRYVGILHLYDLNQENYDTEQAHCTLGFATAEAFRRQGFTLEALRHFAKHIFEQYSVASIIAYTDERNRPAQNLLLKAGFRFAKYELLQDDLYVYFALKRV